ncbi:MAG: MarR family transcriptional regulator [Actinomycetaceae bacterium]|nr:MarR family transcriptional regulator [Arcanobacterium sp.]MDD7505597.1 MarR family transcriptional regulator [Actinomycetaceae bacterium]
MAESELSAADQSRLDESQPSHDPSARGEGVHHQHAHDQLALGESGAVGKTAWVDEVDNIVARWQAQRPDLDVAPLGVFSRLLRLSRHVAWMRKSAFANHGLETWEFEMLAALRRDASHRLTAGKLMQETMVSSGTITNRIDRMEEHGFVTRETDEYDKRVVFVQATQRGIAAVDAAMEELLRLQGELLAPFGTEEVDGVSAFLKVILEEFETDAE